jgi:gamma-glutamylcyclotransferase (GGCT)/AIG2-like uncharacterized protein YtfP
MNTLEKILRKGEKYNKKYLQENDFELINDSTIYFFYRNGINAYVFEKPKEKHEEDYLLVEIWKD